MKKLNTSPISGMQELLPAEQAVFNQIKNNIADSFAHHCFQNIETPTIDRTEILLAKAGGETEKQIYKVVKTAETADEADEALRFDHTVPLARYVVEHANDLAFPFKVSQIGRNFRGERAQKGRFREFYQCDIDVIGRNSLPIEYDAEVIATLYEALGHLNLPNLKVHLSNRRLLNGLLDSMNLNHRSADIYSIVDHATKVPLSVTNAALKDLGLGEENVVKLTTFVGIKGNRKEVESELRSLNVGDADFIQGLEELLQVMEMLEELCPADSVIADMMIVRGLDYYTGTVFETFSEEHFNLGSVCSGGRYDNLASHYTEQSLPGVGGSIGLTRLFYLLNSNGLLDKQFIKPVSTAIIPLSKEAYPFARALQNHLASEGFTADIIYGDKKLGDKMTYAAKIADHACIIGEDEIKSREIGLKDLATGNIETIKIPEF